MSRPVPPSQRFLRRPALIIAGVLVVGLCAFAVWYRSTYSMGTAQSFEVAGAGAAPRVLIATQGSVFKDAVVAGIVTHLKERSARIKVVDISALPAIREGDWDAVAILHTWEMRKPPLVVATFVKRWRNPERLVVLTTSGAGNFKLQGVDAVSSASTLSDVPARVGEITQRLDRVLAAGATTEAAP